MSLPLSSDDLTFSQRDGRGERTLASSVYDS